MWQVQFHVQLYFLLLEERFPKLIISIGNRTEWSTIQEKLGEWFEIKSMITPELYDTKFNFQLKCEKLFMSTAEKRQSKSKENISE